MSVINANPLMLGDAGYNIERSLRFRSSASAYLNRTPATNGNFKTWTWSGWVKRGSLSTVHSIFGAENTGVQQGRITFDANNKLGFVSYISAIQIALTTTAVYRDTSAWYHIIAVLDTTQSVASDRVKLYVNGVQITAFDTATYPAQNYDGVVNRIIPHNVGRHLGTEYFDGYLAEVNFIDGQALTPSSFGETDPITGVWKPKKYSGTYGNNGFYLPFSDNTSATTLAQDKSGNGNNWTANNISTTAGATYDSMTDVPTLTSATAANYCVLNPLAGSSTGAITYSNANLNVRLDRSSANCWATSTFAIPSTGLWYFELSQTATNTGTTPYWYAGVMDITTPRTSVQPSVFRAYDMWDGTKNTNGTTSSYGNTFALNDILGVAIDMNSGKIWFSKNGTWQNSGDPAAGTNAAFTDLVSAGVTWALFVELAGNNTGDGWFNFGQRPFSYTPPTGFKALNTFNLPDPTIKKPNQYMDATTYTGNGAASRTFTGLGFQPDLIWTKNRDTAGYEHLLFDSVRGFGVSKDLCSNSAAAEGGISGVNYGYVSAATSDGYTVIDGGGTNDLLNQSGKSQVAWQWKKGATPGFDIVTWTQANPSTLNHSLGVKPAMIIIKGRGTTTDNWVVWHQNLTNQTTYALQLNTTTAQFSSASLFNSTAPTSTQFTVGTGSVTNGTLAVAYLFAEIAGFSKFGSYTGNGSADGSFVYLGFQPSFIMVKMSSSTGNWTILDNKRLGYNVDNNPLYPNLSNAEGTTDLIDITSNGFKIRTTDASVNTNGGTYIYAAFASSPFKTSLAR